MKKNKFGVAFLCGVMAFGVITCGLPGEHASLQDLENELRSNPSLEKKKQVATQLEAYFAQLKIPDSLSQSLEKQFQNTLATTKFTAPVDPDSGANPYDLEDTLTVLLMQANLARLCKKPEFFSGSMETAEKLAAFIDARTGVKYWDPFVNDFNAFTDSQARAWLKANIAKQGCKTWQDSSERFKRAEYYAALALQNLQQAPDPRIRIEILQRLQYILYQHRSRFDLSLALGEKTEREAMKIGYHLRFNASRYHRAEAMRRNSYYQEAVLLYQQTFKYAQTYRQVPWMDWVARQALLGAGEVLVKLGDYDAAWQAADSASYYLRPHQDTPRLLLLRGDIYLCEARYEQAEIEIRQALARAQAKPNNDTFNHIMSLNNLGVLFERLGEPERAYSYYQLARDLFMPETPDISTKMLVMNNIIDLLAANDDSLQFNALVQDAKTMLSQAPLQFRQAQLLRNIGQWYEADKRYDKALSYYKQSSDTCQKIGRLEYDLGTKLQIASSLAHLSRYAEAMEQAIEVELEARKIPAVERVIDAMGLLANIQFRAGDTLDAIDTSDRFIESIDSLSALFHSPQRLMAYRQKIYGYLKNAARYELAAGHLEAAFSKLDYAKGYVMRHRFPDDPGSNGHAIGEAIDANLDSIAAHIGDKNVLIDYLVADDSLYAFIFDANGLHCLSRNVSSNTLQAVVEAYKREINETIDLFQHYAPDQIGPHFAETIAVSETLYHYLLDWPAVQSQLDQAEYLYIVPDEFLYDVPFSTLIRDRSDPASFEVNQAATTMLPAAGFIAQSHKKSGIDAPETARVLLCVDRRFPQADKFIATVRSKFSHVEILSAESDTVDKRTVLKKLQNYPVYIFLGHAKANPTFPERSYFEMAVQLPKQRKQKIMRLTMTDLRQLERIQAEMVMLIGCETVGKKLYRGTGTSGLHQGFLSMGAKNVFANLWEVDAGQAIPLAERFIESWLETRDIPKALQISKLATIDVLRHKRLYQQPHPYFWGGTVLLTTNPHD